ncbi:MAG TPA: hypothetical protein PKL97_01080 [Candidatus Omnitrophota bacterium]|nr:hypothetical protein [Candidatus Omnitrophota bacterium]
MKRIFIGVTIGLSLLFPHMSFGAETTPESIRAEADANIKMAFQLMQEAQGVLKGGVTREKGEVAISLYTRAGQLMEQSAGVYRALVPHQYASEQEVKNCEDVMQACIRSIREIKQRI